MEPKETILKALQESTEPMKTGQIAEITGLEKSEVDKAIKTLKSEEKIQSPKRCFYSVK